MNHVHMDLGYNTTESSVTVEHCSVIIERLSKILQTAYPGDDISVIVDKHLDPRIVRRDVLTLFTPEAFIAMFQTEMGKGVIIGAFIQKFIFGADE